MEAEYTLPQHTSNMSAMPQEDHRRIAPEPYASSAIYTELNYQVGKTYFSTTISLAGIIW